MPIEKTQDDQQQQQDGQQGEQTAEEVEASEDLAAGFAKANKAKDPAGNAAEPQQQATEKSAAEMEAEKKAQADADAKAARERQAEQDRAEYEALPKVVRERLEKLDGITGAVNKLAGHVGGMKRQLDESLATATAAAKAKGSDAPSNQQVQAALADPVAWGKLKEDFPEWAGPVEKELGAIRAELAQKATTTVDVAAIKAEAKKEALAEIRRELVEDRHPEWEKTVVSNDFKSWMKSQPAEVRALGASDRPRDAITLLDKFNDHQKTATERAAEAAAERERRERRLRRAAGPASGTSGPSVRAGGLSEEEAFARGHKNVASKKA